MIDRRASIFVTLLPLLAACRQDMHDQPAYRPLAKSGFFTDNRSARQVVEGTIARGQLRSDRAYYTGRTGAALPQAAAPPQPAKATRAGAEPGEVFAASFAADLVKELPYPVTREMVERGRDRFQMFCTPCHGYSGYGNGVIVQRGLSQPPSFHIDRLREAPVGHFFDVMTNGYGAMYSYAQRVPVADRWAIIAFIRALQVSQSATVSDVPTDRRSALEQSPQQESPSPSPGEMRPGAPPAPDPRPQGVKPETQR